MNDHGHRTFVGTLVFLDVLDPRPDALECVEQAAARAIGHLEAGDVLTVPHPRGLVLVFPGDPEDGLFVALGLRDALEHEASTRTGFGARMAVHLGPVRIVDGVAQGEGPTVGAQLASVGTPGQIVSSRSFFEVVSSLSAEHRGLLHPLGRKRTADGKELDVYELGSHVEREVEVTWPAGRTPVPGASAAPPVHPIPLVTPVESVPSPPPPSPAPAAAPVIVTGGWVAGALEELGAFLARSIGPLAHTLVRRAARATEDPRSLVAELAESIENGDDRRKFEDFARSWTRRSRAIGGVPATPGPPYTPGAPYTPGMGQAPGMVLTPMPQQQASPRAMGGPMMRGASQALTAEQRAVLEAALAPHLGPIAKVMVARVVREAPDWGTACQTLSASIPDNVSREDFLRTLSDPGHLRTRTPPRSPGRTAIQAHPAPTQARPAAPPPVPARGSPSRPTPAAEHPPSPMPRASPSRPPPAGGHPPSPMPRGSPSRPVPVQPPPPQRGSPSRPTPVVESPPLRGRALVEDDLHRAEQALALSLGPVARTLVKRAARNANTPWELFASLAAELPEGPERERFLAAQPEV
ncbi:MAG: hypothetical protein ACXWK4_03670 [Myxococcaceae bacterium]